MQLCHYNCKRHKQKRNPIKNGLLNAKCTQLAGNAGGQNATTAIRICRLKLQSSQNKLAAPQYGKGDSHRQIMNVNQPRLGYSVSNALSRHKRKYSHNHQADGYLQTKHAEQSGQADSSPQTIGNIDCHNQSGLLKCQVHSAKINIKGQVAAQTC